MLGQTGIILVVDRGDEVFEILRTALQSTNYALLQAKTGEAALDLLSRPTSDIDLAIIDLDLPNDDGLVINLLTIFGRRKTTKIIVKTSSQDKPFLEQVHYFGVDAIVLNPISEEQMIKTVQATLSERRNLPPSNAATVGVRSKVTQNTSLANRSNSRRNWSGFEKGWTGLRRFRK
jgi:DNA-binding NarL/FixJ family response regulator